MPIADLTLATGRTNLSSGTSIPDNGDNTFLHGWDLDPGKIDTDQIVLRPIALGPSVSAVTFVSLSADGLSLTVSVTQAGADQLFLSAEHVHSVAQ